MTDLNDDLDAIDEIVEESEIDSLKARATQMGVGFHPNIGLEKLRKKVNDAIQGKAEEAPEEVKPEKGAAKEETLAEKRFRIKKLATELIRVEVTCMNPQKKEWEGEILTSGNSLIGSVKKMVPFNTPWHVPRILLNMMEERKCQIFHSTKDSKGNTIRKGKLIKEFAINYLPKLTEEEIKKLAQRQAMAAGTSQD